MFSALRRLPCVISAGPARGIHATRAAAGGSSFQDVVRAALEKHSLGGESDRIVKVLENEAVSDMSIAASLSDADWQDIGLKVGERRIVQDAVAAENAASPGIGARTYSRGGVMSSHHQRTL